MPLDAAAALAAATTYADGVIAANPSITDQIPGVRDLLITAKQDELIFLFDVIKANAEVLPSGTPALAAGGDAVTGKGVIT